MDVQPFLAKDHSRCCGLVSGTHVLKSR